MGNIRCGVTSSDRVPRDTAPEREHHHWPHCAGAHRSGDRAQEARRRATGEAAGAAAPRGGTSRGPVLLRGPGFTCCICRGDGCGWSYAAATGKSTGFTCCICRGDGCGRSYAAATGKSTGGRDRCHSHEGTRGSKEPRTDTLV